MTIFARQIEICLRAFYERRIKIRIFALMRVFTFVIAFLLVILPDYAPAASFYDAADVSLEEVVDTEEEAILLTSSRSQIRVPSLFRPFPFRQRIVKYETPQLSICRSIERQWLVSCSLRL